MTDKVATSVALRERQLFLAALEKTVEADRATFLDAACGGDNGLRQRVEALLREQAEVGSFMQEPALGGVRPSTPPGQRPDTSSTSLFAAVTEKAGDRIGRYKLLQLIGEGGCGVVYMAEQEEPIRRRVALKIIKLGMDTKSVIARFEAERQALAMMDHPNIARVLDAGATEKGRPYFVMELVRGIKITEYCDQNNLPTRDRLSLFIQVCQAIQHAHQKGIIHRDIKPSNILITLHDGVPVPKVIDFGIAKATEQRLTEKTLFTEFQAFIGTPAYTSPEQAEMSGLDVDTRSDVYSLGVLLYEFLTGRTPFKPEDLLRSGLQEMRRLIREEEPVRPSTCLSTLGAADAHTITRTRQSRLPALVHAVQGDLDWIVMKCLEKDRTRRYATVNALAEDLQRFLDSEPVLARPPSTLYRVQKFIRRHRAVLAAAVAITATLISGAVVSTWQAVRATRAEHTAVGARKNEEQLRQQAEREKASARLNEYVAHINLAQQSLVAGNYGRAVQLLNKHRPASGEPDLRGFEWRYLWRLARGDKHETFPSQDGPVQSVAVSPDGELLAIGLREKLNIWRVRFRSLVTSLPKGALSMVFTPDGKSLVTAGPSVRVWNTLDWTERLSLAPHSAPIALSSDGTRLATESREGVRIWDTTTWTEVRTLHDASGPMAFSPDGKTLVTDSRPGPPDGGRAPPPDPGPGASDGQGPPPNSRPGPPEGRAANAGFRLGLTLWSLESGRASLVLEDSTNVFMRGGPWFRSDRVLAFSPDGKHVVAARNTLSERGVFVLSVWDTATGKLSAVIPEDPEHIEHTGIISGLVFSPDGSTLATSSMDHSIRLWDFAKRRRVATLQGHLNEVWAIAFSPNGQTLVSGAKDGGVKLWSTRRESKEDVVQGGFVPLAFSRDGRTLAVLNRLPNRDEEVTFLNSTTGETEREFSLERTRFRFGFGGAVSLSEDLRTLAQALDDGAVRIWNTETSETTTVRASNHPVDSVALSPDGRVLITNARGQVLNWWDLRACTNAPLSGEAMRVVFSPDGRTFATLQRSNIIQLWDTATHSVRANVETDSGFAVAFSPNGKTFATGSPAGVDNTVRLWDAASGKLLGSCTGHKQGVVSIAFSADGKTLASSSEDSTLKFWNVATQQELLSFRRLGGTLMGLLFSPDGRLLVGANSPMSPSGGLRFYRAPAFGETDVAAKE